MPNAGGLFAVDTIIERWVGAESSVPPPVHLSSDVLPLGGTPDAATPPDTAGLFSEGAEVIQRHIEGSLTTPTPCIKRV